MKVSSLSAVAGCCLFLSACGGSSAPAPKAPEAVPAPVATSLPTPVPVPLPGPVRDNANALPANLVVSTNEPFWSARVEGSAVVLAGPQGERRLIVESNESTATGRRVQAADATGRLEIQVTSQPCEDDMSGAAFPYTGSLSFDGGAVVKGCARPASLPVPAPAS